MAPAKKAAAKPPPKTKPAEPHEAKPIGVEPVIRVGGHTLTEDGWVPDKEE